MKRVLLFFTFCLFGQVSVYSQDLSNSGNWFYILTNKEPKNHWVQPLPFPESAADYSGQIEYSAMEKSKMRIIAEVLREVYPKPKLHSNVFQLVPLFNSDKMDKSKIPTRDYRFGYRIDVSTHPMTVENGKLQNSFKLGYTDIPFFHFLSVNINYIPDFLGGWGFEYDGPKINLEKHFTYQEINGKESN
ncbi:MAG: hypothetical protein K1X55_03050 [Chitinophagales bacterium]|nr:hypothetical protein [Chitinophagales bacterium]